MDDTFAQEEKNQEASQDIQGQNVQNAPSSDTSSQETPPQQTPPGEMAQSVVSSSQNTTQNTAPQPQSQSPAPPPVKNVIDQSAIVGPHSNSGSGKGFKIFVIIGILIILAVWGGVGYLYLQNKKTKEEGAQSKETPQEVVEATPTPDFMPDQIKISGGNVVREKPNGEVSVLVDKGDYESTGITGFLKAVVSPDNNKICFESWSPAPEPALYISDIDGANVVEVSPNRQNCLWANDSKSVYYINTSSKTAPVNIFSYNLETELETDLTSSSVPSGVVRRFEIVGLSADASKLICKYENLGGAAATEAMSECEVDLETGEVNSI